MLLEGVDVEQDEMAAIGCQITAADLGDIHVQYNAGITLCVVKI